MPKSKSKSKSNEDPVEGEAALPVRKRAAGSKKSDDAPAKKPRGRPKGSRNKTTTTLIPDSGAMELGIAAAHALSMPANAAGFAATLGMPSLPASITQGDDDLKPIDRGDMPKARETRLEQNRKAARESRRRKKVMIEELQRSVIFFSRANATLKTQNEEFQRLLIQAQTQIAQMEANGEVPKADGAVEVEADGAASAAEAGATGADVSTGSGGAAPVDTQAAQQAVAAAQAAQQSFQFMQAQAAAQANAAAMQASFESQGYPPAAARAAAQTFSAAGGDGNTGASVSGQGGMVSMDPQALMQMQQAWMAQNPAFMQQFAMMAQQAGGGAAASAPAPTADNGSATV